MGPQVCLRDHQNTHPYDRRHDQMLLVCLLLKDVFTMPLERPYCTALYLIHIVF